jgi:PhnB protein
MPIKKATPYLFFNGTAEKAIRLYERTLGARTVGDLMRYRDMPASAGAPCSPVDADRVMHACLQIGEAQLMASDTMPGDAGSAGANVQICLDFDDPQEMARSFEALAASGKVTMALHDTFWGAKFGTLTDEFGVSWMFNCMQQKA